MSGFFNGTAADGVQIAQLQARVAELEQQLQIYKNALWKASGDDRDTVNSYIESQTGVSDEPA
jgi:hypothetical protein